MRTAALLVLAGSLAQMATAQEALRASQANSDAADGRKKAASTLGYYNLKVGPAGLYFSTSLGLSATDNVELTEKKPESDLTISPQLNAQLQWPVTELNSLNLKVGVGYSEYINHSALSRWYILPGSALSFDLYIGEVWINLHDGISISQNAYQDPTVTGAGGYSQLGNSAGLSGVWSYNDKGDLKLGYDHANNLGLTGNQGASPSSSSELFYGSVDYALKAETRIGLQLSGGLTSFSGTNATEATQWNVGGFYNTPVSDYIQFQASAGYTVYETTLTNKPNISTTNIPIHATSSVEQSSGFYAQIALSHRLNQYLNYSLSGGRSVSFTLYGGAFEIYTAGWQGTWNLFEHVSIGTGVTFEHGTQIASNGETFERFGTSLSLGRTITEKLSGGLTYQFYDRRSDQAAKSYTANILSLNFSYKF